MLAILLLLIPLGMIFTSKEAIHYIRKSRKSGFDDEKIRVKMLLAGYMPTQLNDYFQKADDVQSGIKNFTYISVIVLILFGSILIVGKNADLTGAVPWSWPWSTTYDCGDDYPAEERYVKDLSDCIGDEEATKNVLFCYINNTVDVEDLSLGGANDDWYWEHLGVNLSLYTTIDSVSLFGAADVLPYNSSVYDNVDCYSWNHGTTRTENWHQCNETESGEPPNLIFYYIDRAVEEGIGDGGLGADWDAIEDADYNSSYYLCYDELNCTTETSACDESAGEYCIGRLENEAGSPWHPCDTQVEADYYRCCKGGCDAMEMMCGEYVGSDTRSAVEFNECRSDGTFGCCDSSTDCVYNNTCYNEDETIRYHYLQLGVSGTVDIEAIDEYYTFACSDGHWCPEGFYYSSIYSQCIPIQAACYDSTDPDYCNYIYGEEGVTDLWEADTTGGYPCTRTDPERIVSSEACVYTGTYGGVDYFFYQDILVDV